MKLRLYLFGLLGLALVLAACETPVQNIPGPAPVDPVQPDPVTPDIQTTPDNQPHVESGSDEVKTFKSKEDLIQYLKNSGTMTSYSTRSFGMNDGMAMDMAVAESTGGVAMTKSAAPQVAEDFSQTNVQVQGVDEADIVKNDGKYIYTLSGNKLVIVDAFPAEDAEVVYEDEIDGTPMNMFVNGDRLVVFSVAGEEFPVIAEYDYVPRPRWTQVTHAYLFDITDRDDPELVQDYSLKGNFQQARMIGDHVYFIVNENVYWYNNIIDMPVVRGGDAVLVSPKIHYFDNPEDNHNFNTVASFDITKEDDINAETYLLGYTNTIYVSEDNIYITYQKNYPYWNYQDQQKDRFYDVVVPLLPDDIQDEIKKIRNDGSLKENEQWDEIAGTLEEMYNELSSMNRNSLLNKIEDAIEEYEAKKEAERRKTVIHKIAIDDGDIDYETRGEVSGYLLNQFSMDEHDGNLRVATTTYIWRGKNQMYNNVFVLDEELDEIGSIEDIAPDERIYSTRFLGDRLYMVTFKRIDPLFVIDLSDPTDPEILGELKIPGYSDYLHPYDENHIIGIGKETEGNEWGGISTGGVKLSLFDVSDVENPKQIDKYEIGDRGTDSEALQDHKAFLFDKEKDVLVIPVREVKGDRYYDEQWGYYRQRVWQGAYVFSLDPDSGFDVKGKISHADGTERSDYYYYTSPNAVRRALFMDDVLYTISSAKILMNDIDDPDEEINEVELPYEEENRYPRPWY